MMERSRIFSFQSSRRGTDLNASIRGIGARRGPTTATVGETMFRSFAKLLFLAVILLLPTIAARADDAGTALYKSKCASCHGADGSGNTTVGKSLKVRDLRSADVQKMTDAELIKVTSDGKGKMPAYGKKLSADQIKSLVAAIRAMAPK
jgi:cytochrome c6